ncbi:alpha-galactosidase [Dysgonomonas macrotermitis]|uniref:Alpha-galactosidase n=1 Tax=Dysgonomonas macrotermitis TaxID=1346286 RepID=A0A1M4XZM3_9BACT|nr:alpha-galactosidase [Dysgonomonas macrotermitis]SHE98890.1 alpha-galactosidase [Dysgonomonas macrotermitis]
MKALVLSILLFFLAAVTTPGQTKEIIQVETNNLAMIFTASPGGKVVFQYWGNKLNGASSFLDRKVKGQPDTSDDFASQLYPAYGGRYYLNPALKLTHDDGVLTTELVYAGSQTKSLDDNRTETIISLKDKLYPVFVDVRFVSYNKENIISQSVTISHSETKEILVENLASSYIPLHAESYYLTHFNGTWALEMQMEEEELTHGTKVIESKKGIRTTQSENSAFILSLNGPSKEDSGEVYAGALAWSGNYKLSFELDETGKLGITAGMNPFASTFHLKPGQKLETPEMILTYNANGIGQISRNFHDWTRKYNMAHGDQLHPIILNSWEGAYFDYTEKTITDMMDDAARFGIEMFVLDDGWFGNKYPRNGDNAGLGDWQTNKTKLPRGIPYLADYAVSKGMKFGIWIEPEMVNPDSELAGKHPEWIIKSGKRDILPMRNQWQLDLSNPDVQDFVFNTFDEVVSMSPNISYVKWDANRHVDNVGSEYLPANEQTHFWREYIKGLYSVYDRIRDKYPDIQIQLCSAGGGRVDFGALKYHDEIWASDNTNALDRIFIQYGTNLFFPAIVTGSHVSTSPNHQTGMMIPLKFRFDVAMSGRLGMELQPKDIGDEYEFAANAIKDYKLIRPVVQLGDLYRLISPYDKNGWASHMYVAKDKKQAVFFAYSLKYHGRTTYFETKLNGLDADKNYKITELNVKSGRSSFYGNGQTFTGDYLMKAGINLNIGNPFDSTVLLITEE